MLKELLEKRAGLTGEIRRLADLHTANGDFTADERTQWEKVNADYDANNRAVEVAQRAATVDAESIAALSTIARPEARGVDRVEGLPTEEHRQLAMRAWVRSAQGNDPTDACTTLMESSTVTRWVRPPVWSTSVRPRHGRISAARPATRCDRLSLVDTCTVSPTRARAAAVCCSAAARRAGRDASAWALQVSWF